MGEAKRRAASYQLAKDSLFSALQPNAQIVAQTAISLFERFVLPNGFTGGCYLTTMFLHRYLMDEKGIITEPVVGYINDGTDDIFMSHAWLEYEGAKTDITIFLTAHPDAQLPGALLIMDRVIRPGQVFHSYHREMSPAGHRANEKMGLDPELAELTVHKAIEHQQMAERAADSSLMQAYLDKAPDELSYRAMRAAVE